MSCIVTSGFSCCIKGPEEGALNGTIYKPRSCFRCPNDMFVISHTERKDWRSSWTTRQQTQQYPTHYGDTYVAWILTYTKKGRLHKSDRVRKSYPHESVRKRRSHPNSSYEISVMSTLAQRDTPICHRTVFNLTCIHFSSSSVTKDLTLKKPSEFCMRHIRSDNRET